MTRIRNMKRRWKVATVAGVLALAASTSSFAYFTASGSGSSGGSVGSPAELTISPATPTSQLYPSGSSDVALTISNPNEFSIHVNSLDLDSGGITASTSCDTSKVHFASQSNSGAGWDVDPKAGAVDGTLSLHLAAALSMDADAPDDCQGATFTVYLRTGP
jgi:hypothetical protein